MKVRRWINTLTAFSLALHAGVTGCRSEAERRLAGSVRRELEHGGVAAKQWIAQAADSTNAAIATGYLERLRLGLGSPFRLVDLALHDPRLPDSMRTTLGWALLDRVRSGDTYDIEPIVLDRAGSARAQFAPGAGRTHLAIIEKKLESVDSLRAAELGLRMGYALAAAEGIVSNEAPQLVGSVAALLTDRKLAQRDAERFLQGASSEADALGLLLDWRNTREFTVEQPRSGPVPPEVEIEAIRVARSVLADLREWGIEVAAHGIDVRKEPVHASLLSSDGIARLRLADALLDLPPETPVVIAARQLSREVQQMQWLSASQQRLREKFGAAATTEEAFAAEHARLRTESEHDAGPARVAMQAAVALRAYAQERIWFPGMPAPAPGDLEERYGLAAVTFDRSVPAQWRPYYRRMLASSLSDLSRVMPALRLNGLRIHFGPLPEGADALAIHDPRTRELMLPPATAAGTLAHELAHDIDWQMSVRRYHVRGDYATDRSTRSTDDGLAANVRNLAIASLALPRMETRLSAHAKRPAEIFARGVDWYVAVSLAQEGRRNGYLSSVQDELLTGYGTVRPPDVSGAAGDALLSILAELAPVYREQRTAFRALYGTRRTPRAYDLVRTVTEASGQPTIPSFVGELQSLQTRRSAALVAVNGATCGISDVSDDLRTARRELVAEATTASARGIALRYSWIWLGERGRDLLFRTFYGGPSDVRRTDAATLEYVTQIASEVDETTRPETSQASPFVLEQSTRCN